MPSETVHTARINDPDKYEKIRRKNDEFGKGIDVNFGVLKNGDMEVQSIYFAKDKFTAVEARKWLKDHDYKPIEFVAASDEEKEKNPEDEEDKKRETETEKEDDDKEEDEEDSEKCNISKTQKSKTFIHNRTIEYKIFNFNLLEAKQNSVGEQYGVIKGYASTYGNVDACNDLMMEGAFNDSLLDYKARNRMIKVYYQHNAFGIPIGGIKPENIDSDKTGLPVTIDINKDVQLAKEVYSLVKQGVLSDMSIGYIPEDVDYSSDGVRLLRKVALYEVSIVGEPANSQARISEVKNKQPNKFKFFSVTDLKHILSKKDLEDVLRESGSFSKEAATFLAARFIEEKKKLGEPSFSNSQILYNLNEIKLLINQL